MCRREPRVIFLVTPLLGAAYITLLRGDVTDLRRNTGARIVLGGLSAWGQVVIQYSSAFERRLESGQVPI